jgi:hypothetical protein
MTNITKLRKGLDIPLEGVAEKKISAYNTGHYAVKPTDFLAYSLSCWLRKGTW